MENGLRGNRCELLSTVHTRRWPETSIHTNPKLIQEILREFKARLMQNALKQSSCVDCETRSKLDRKGPRCFRMHAFFTQKYSQSDKASVSQPIRLMSLWIESRRRPSPYTLSLEFRTFNKKMVVIFSCEVNCEIVTFVWLTTRHVCVCV